MAENTREIILDTLLTLERERTFSHKLIKAVLDKYDYLDGREKAFIKRVTEGTIERQIELDYYLNHFSSVPVRKMKPLIRCLLRMSTYQLVFMDAIPDSAVCNEACKLAAKRKFANLKGFVNGVLRNIAKNKENLPLPDENQDRAEFLSVKYSMPQWLVEYWMKAYGEKTTGILLEAMLKVHPVSLRFCTELTEQEREKLLESMQALGARVKASSELSYVYQVENIENITQLPGFLEGSFTVQDVSSALAVEAADIQEGDFCMDICAAPGGKSILAAEKAGATGRVLSRDVSEAKVSLIEENIQRMHRDNIQVEVHDATVFDAACAQKADVVIMDVPCSGLGVIGKKRDIKYHVTPESLVTIVELQKKIVESSWKYVKPGGILLYSTCTMNPGENEEMVKWITDNFPFVLEKQKQILPGYMEADGFFYAKLRRNGDSYGTENRY